MMKGGLRVHTCPKVASSSISGALSKLGCKHAFPDEYGHGWRFMAVRHPLDRIVSAFAFFTRDKERIQGQRDMVALGYYYGMPWGEFFRLVMDKHAENPHTQMQTDFAGPIMIDQPVRLAGLAAAWDGLRERFPFLHPMLHYNRSDRGDWGGYYDKGQRAEAERVFAGDMALYEGATG